MQSSLWRSGELYQKRKILSQSTSSSTSDLVSSTTNASSTASTSPLRSSTQSMSSPNSTAQLKSTHNTNNGVVRSSSTSINSTSKPATFSVSMNGDGGVTVGSISASPQPTTSRSTNTMGRSNSVQKERMGPATTVLSSKEKLKADMRAITATLKVSRRATVKYTREGLACRFLRWRLYCGWGLSPLLGQVLKYVTQFPDMVTPPKGGATGICWVPWGTPRRTLGSHFGKAWHPSSHHNLLICVLF